MLDKELKRCYNMLILENELLMYYLAGIITGIFIIIISYIINKL